MDAEALKIILDLKKENVLLKKAISDAIIRLVSKDKYKSSAYNNQDVNFLFSTISRILKEKQQPTKESE